MGRTLRRFTALRLAVVFYVVLLHVWVVFVLAFSSLPAARYSSSSGGGLNLPGSDVGAAVVGPGAP